MNCNTTHYRANSSSVPGDPTAGSTERLAVLAEIVGLGVPGIYGSNREAGARKLAEVLPRLSAIAEIDQTERVCPEAYRNVDTRKLTLPPVRSLTSVAIAAVGMIVVVVAAYFMLFARASGDLRRTLQQIKDSGGTTVSSGNTTSTEGGAK